MQIFVTVHWISRCPKKLIVPNHRCLAIDHDDKTCAIHSWTKLFPLPVSKFLYKHIDRAAKVLSIFDEVYYVTPFLYNSRINEKILLILPIFKKYNFTKWNIFISNFEIIILNTLWFLYIVRVYTRVSIFNLIHERLWNKLIYKMIRYKTEMKM